MISHVLFYNFVAYKFVYTAPERFLISPRYKSSSYVSIISNYPLFHFHIRIQKEFFWRPMTNPQRFKKQ